jgi:deazaflavin-dependent oxidoreductase (nitroreductase family)
VDKRRVSTALSRFGANPLVRAFHRLGIPFPGTAILETVGRKTGKVRRTPVTNGLDGDVFWIVAEHGRRAGYVRNLEASPRVRVKAGRRWRAGTATIVPDDDPRERLRKLSRGPAAASARMVPVMGSDLLSIRIDLDPEPGRAAKAREGEQATAR